MDGFEPLSPAPSAVVRIGMQTSLVAPGTLRGLQFRALFQLPSPAFPVQVAVHVCACARLPVTATASKAPARKSVFTLCIFFIDIPSSLVMRVRLIEEALACSYVDLTQMIFYCADSSDL